MCRKKPSMHKQHSRAALLLVGPHLLVNTRGGSRQKSDWVAIYNIYNNNIFINIYIFNIISTSGVCCVFTCKHKAISVVYSDIKSN